MNKKLLSIILTIALVASFTGIATAQTFTETPVIEINTSAPIYVGDFFTLTASTPHRANDVVNTWRDEDSNLLSDTAPIKIGPDYISSLTLQATEPGTFTFFYWIRMWNPGNEWVGDADIDVIVLASVTVIVENPAAPAIAAKLLKQAGISPNYDKRGNYISDVARIMTNRAVFQGIEKDDTTNYENAIKAYLISRGLSL